MTTSEQLTASQRAIARICKVFIDAPELRSLFEDRIYMETLKGTIRMIARSESVGLRAVVNRIDGGLRGKIHDGDRYLIKDALKNWANSESEL